MSLKKLPARKLGRNGPTVNAIGLGSMGELNPLHHFVYHICSIGMGAYYGKSDDEQSFKTLTYAADRGMTFWDTSDIYGTSTFGLSLIVTSKNR